MGLKSQDARIPYIEWGSTGILPDAVNHLQTTDVYCNVSAMDMVLILYRLANDEKEKSSHVQHTCNFSPEYFRSQVG